MKTQRKYKCKNEELVVICDYVQSSFTRDLAEFTAFAPKFNQQYLTDFKNKNEAMNQVIFPQEKTKELKLLTARLYANMDKLLAPLDHLEGYVKLAASESLKPIEQDDEDDDDVEVEENDPQTLPFTPADFGITTLRQKLRRKDAEGVLKGLQLINSNIEKNSELLIKQGLSTTIINQFKAAFPEIDTDNQKQYEIVSKRRLLTDENIKLLNALYDQMMEICQIGKVLYKSTQKVKLPDYTFSYLIKKVRIS